MSKNCSYLVKKSDLPLILNHFLFQFVTFHSKKWDSCLKWVKNVGHLSKMVKKMSLQIFRTVSKYLRAGKNMNLLFDKLLR